MASRPEKPTFTGTNNVSVLYSRQVTVTSRDSFGRTVRKGLTGLAGSVTSAIGRWLTEERLSGITGSGILFSAALLSFLAGVWLGVRYIRTHAWDLYVGQQHLMMVGVAQVPGQEGMFIPVYKNVSDKEKK